MAHGRLPEADAGRGARDAALRERASSATSRFRSKRLK